MDVLFHIAPPMGVLVVAFVAIQLGYLVCTSISVFFMTRPVDWVDVEEAAAIPERNLPRIILLYPVLQELEETMRTTFLSLQRLDYPDAKFEVVAIPNSDDHETIEKLDRLFEEFDFLTILPIPPTSDRSWHRVWRAWERNKHCYWWHEGKRAKCRDLPPKKTRQLIYAFYFLVDHIGDDWVLDYIDADSVPPSNHFKAGAAGLQHYDVLQSTNISGNPLDSWAASWHSMDHMSWDGNMYPHFTSHGKHPFWVLGKGLFFKARDLVRLGGFNPWLTIEDPEVGMRLWKNGCRLGVIPDPLVEEVPVTIGRGITQRKRWVCGFLQSVGTPLKRMGYTWRQRMRARLTLVPCFSLLLNPLGLVLGSWSLWGLLAGWRLFPMWTVPLCLANLVLAGFMLTTNYYTAWVRSGMVLDDLRDRLHFMLRVSPPALIFYWMIWSVPIVIGINMFRHDRGLVWERTEKVDANHGLVRGQLVRRGEVADAA